MIIVITTVILTTTTTTTTIIIIMQDLPFWQRKYMISHDKFCTHKFLYMQKILGIETAENWYSYISTAVCEHEDTAVLWNKGYKQLERFWPIGRHNN
jgi:hypothetical protein